MLTLIVPWERGSNENNNKLIRKFIKKKADIKNFSSSYIKKIQDWINNYPRKLFNYKSANDIFYENLNDIKGYQIEYGMVPRDGIEPSTRGFSVLCSTDWAIWAIPFGLRI